MVSDMIGKLAPNSTCSKRWLDEYVPGRGFFRAASPELGNSFRAFPPDLLTDLAEGGQD